MRSKNTPSTEYFTQDEFDHWAEFARAFCWRTDNEPLFSTVRQNSPNQVWHYAVPVAYLGLWDTVKAAGFLRFGTLRWPYTRVAAQCGAHPPCRLDRRTSSPLSRIPRRRHPLGLEERWFAGVHADVGGTFMPDHRLATIALKWIVDGVVGELALDAAPTRSSARCTRTSPTHRSTTTASCGTWSAVGVRPMGPDALVHPSVLVRRRDNPGYLPNLTAEQQRLSADPTDWTNPAL